MQYIMKGGNPLVGEVTIGGAKNAALPILAAAIMTDEDVLIENLPNVNDINVMLEAMKGIGVVVDRIDAHTVRLNGGEISEYCVDNEYIRNMRAGYYLLGAMLGKYQHAEVALPGGCKIGARPIDQHMKGFRALNAKAYHKVVTSERVYEVDEIADVKSEDEFRGLSEDEANEHIQRVNLVVDAQDLLGPGVIAMDVVSVGATINVMMAAVRAKGCTIIKNAAKEPHVVDVANMLNRMGADIRGAGTNDIKIRGVERLHGTEYTIIPDQIETGTFMMAAAVTRGDVLVRNVIPKHMEEVTAKLVEMGCEIVEFEDAIRVVGRPVQKGCNVNTLPYPGFPTDMQPQMGVALCFAGGTARIEESIFENRFGYVEELRKMGANIRMESSRIAVFTGGQPMKGADVKAPDLRAGAALVIAGLAAEGITSVDDIKYILRGYENFDEKLQGLGAEIIMARTQEEADAFRASYS